jgi:hypothetical protein
MTLGTHLISLEVPPTLYINDYLKLHHHGGRWTHRLGGKQQRLSVYDCECLCHSFPVLNVSCLGV